MNVKELQTLQRVYDAEYYDARHAVDELSCVRHVTLHLGKLLGKISSFAEVKEHGTDSSSGMIQTEVIPDLLFWALHLANRYNLNLEEVYQARLAQNKERIDRQKKGI